MAVDSIIPDWAGEDDANVPPVGVHIVIVRIERATFDESWKGKPFVHLNVKVIEGEYKGMEFAFDVYFSPRAERMARYFLKKFDYPAELLAQKKTPLRSQALIGLQGKVLLKVEEGDDGFLKFNSMGYAHWPPGEDSGELEKRLAKMLGQGDAEAQDDVPVIQLEEEEAETIPGVSTGPVATPLAAQPPGDDPSLLAFLDDLPRCDHPQSAWITSKEDGKPYCQICLFSGPWDNTSS